VSTARSNENGFVLVKIGHLPFAFPIGVVREIVQMPKITSIPQCNSYVRGVIRLRESVIPVVDMRVRMGMTSCVQESESYTAMLDEREEDHRVWLKELELSVKENRAFNLAHDPRQCAFGKWYYAYDPHSSTNRCLALDQTLIKFENPHSRIHAIAEKVLKMEKAGDFEGASRLIEKTRETDLNKMIALFDEARKVIKENSRELAVVIELEKKLALAVDVVESIEQLDENEDERTSIAAAGLDDRLVEKVCIRKKDSSLLYVLNVGELFNSEALHQLV
jgi:chemotaxis signal transduction protein